MPEKKAGLLARMFPRYALNRYANQMRLEHMKREYEAVKKTRRRRQRLDMRSADQINSVSVDKMRATARYLDENHDLARSVLNTSVSQVVGGGLVTFPMPKRPDGTVNIELADRLTILWNDWSKRPEVTHSICWAKVQQLAWRSMFRDGEIFIQRLPGRIPGLRHGSEVAYSLEPLEADFIPVEFNDPAQGIRQGVKKNAWGRPVAYYAYKHYPTEGPGDIAISSLLSLSSGVRLADVKKVDADRIIHLAHLDRFRQTRGMSALASVITRLDDLKDYEESERMAARMGAAFAIAINKSVDTHTGVESGTSFREMNIAPGMIFEGMPGETVSTVKTERPDNKLGEFRRDMLRAVAGGTDTAHSSISKDFDGSYSSRRQELVEQGRTNTMLRGHFVDVVVQPIYQDFINVAALQGLIDVRNADPLSLYDADHVGMGTAYIEPMKEVQADLISIQAGIQSLTGVQLARALNPREVHKQLVRERELQQQDGLVLLSDHANSLKMTENAGPDEEDETDDDGRAYVIGRTYQGDDGNTYKFTSSGFQLIAERTG